ncbi:MAG: ATP-binding protein, partial [Oscillospiraceae bacterium]
VARVIETRERQSLEEVLFATQNDERILNLVLSPLINSKNRLAGIVLVGTDLTDRRFMEHEVEQSRQFGLLGEIAAGIAHDVKNPLMNIRGSARIIERAPEATPAQKPLLNIIIHEVDRIDTVIEQMLSFGNLSKTANYTRISINEVLSNCVQIVNRQKNNKVINVVCQFGDNLPCIRADNSAIQQVFLNILLNSVQAIQQDGSIFISTCYLGESRSTEVIIRDNGVGISPQNLKKIFSPYFTTKASGTGLGLFLVKRILEQIHATLSIVSTVGKGTEITLLFPDSEEVLCHVS